MAHRIDHPSAAPGDLFTEGDPVSGTPATVVTADWLNDTVQEEIVGVVEAAGLTPAKANNGQLLEAINILAGGAGGGFGNLFVNPRFRFWQRSILGVTTTAGLGGQYGADRWNVSPGDGTGAVTANRQEHVVGQTDVPNGSQYFLRFDQTTGSTSTQPWLEQRIEDVKLLENGDLSISFWARTDSGTVALTPQVVQNFGTGGSAEVKTNGTQETVTTTWTRFSQTIAVPAIAGKTLGNDASGFDDHYTSVRLLLPASSTFLLEVSDAQAEAGSNVSAFNAPPMEVDLHRCQRFYEKTHEVDADPGGTGDRGNFDQTIDAGSATADEPNLVRFQDEKRTVPTMRWSDPISATPPGNSEVNWQGNNVTVTSTPGVSTKTPGKVTVGSARSAGQRLQGHYEADAEL